MGDVRIGGRSLDSEASRYPKRLDDLLNAASDQVLAQHRTLDSAVDLLESSIRERLRHLVDLRMEYLITQRAFIGQTQLIAATFEQIVVPPAGATPRPSAAIVALLDHSRRAAETRGHLVDLWTSFQAGRLTLERNLGPLLDADWSAFFGRFTTPPGPPEPAPTQP